MDPIIDKIFSGKDFFLIAGPCVIETEEHTFRVAKSLRDICRQCEIPYVFKSSYDKANRTSIHSFRGPGFSEGLKILKRIKDKLGVAVTSDIHSTAEAEQAASVLDIIQIPAFLCRQTDLLIAAGDTGKPVNVKKGQFLAPWDVKNVVEKVLARGNEKVMVTERGTTFGYNNLVVDMRSLVILGEMNIPVVFDATHSVQLPGGSGQCSSGQRKFVWPLVRAALAVGVQGIFTEVHEDPDNALCDGPNSLPLGVMDKVIADLKRISDIKREDLNLQL